MKFCELPLKGAFLINTEPFCDERGSFSRYLCKKEFEQNNLCGNFVQASLSENSKKGTLRGLHYQIAPYEEIKLVGCIQGSIYDVIVDLRKDSPTFKQYFAAELSSKNNTFVYIPKGFAHGFLTLEDNSTVSYHMSEFFTPESYRGIRYNDPTLKISWVQKPEIISNKDKNYPDFII